MLGILTGILLLVLLAPILLGRDKRLFHGLNLYCFLNAVLIVPGVVVLIANPDLLNPDIHFAVPPQAPAIAWTIAMIVLLNLMVYAGYYWATRGRIAGKATLVRPVALHGYESNLAIALLMGLAFAVFLQKLSVFGGLAGVLSSVQNRVALQAGLGPINFLASAATILATVIATRRAAAERNAIAYGVLLVVALAAAVMFSMFGGRKDSIQLAVMILVVLSLYSADFLRFRPRTVIMVAGAYGLALLYFISILVYRSGLGTDLSLGNFVDQMALSFDGYQDFLLSLSYFDTYFFITNFFDASNFYHGATFGDLLTAFVPSGLMPDKPPVDDGMFVRAATLGYILQPGTPGYLIEHNSFPPETLGAAYMNGGAFLVGVFGLLLGAILGRVQKLIQRLPNSPFVVALYLNVFINFEISNLRIVQLIALSGFTLLLIAVLRGLTLVTGRPAQRPALPQGALAA